GCERCVEVCEFNAIDIVDVEREYEDVSLPIKKAVINSALCKGCGKCSSVCRLKAIDAKHYDFNQISKIVDPYFLERVKEIQVGEKAKVEDTATIIN
ncbi:MAG: CoB--CoM heterodisulfide reductase iron-sulfur subunit A, partial [Candidatus Lokiarchaeum sp. GC14_75]